MANKALPTKSSENFHISPFRIYIPGHDGSAQDDAENVRMSIESNAKEPVSSLIESIAQDGNEEPIKVIKVPCEASDPFAWEHKGKTFRVEVIFGRHRIRAARSVILDRGIDPSDEANPGFVFMRNASCVSRMNEETQARLIIAENFARRTPDPIAQAEDIVRYEQMGLSIAEIAKMMGESLSSIKNKKSLSNLAPEIQDQVRSGEVGKAAAYEVAKLDDHDDQHLAVMTGANGTHPEAIKAVDDVRRANAEILAGNGERVEILTQDPRPEPKIVKPKKRDIVELREVMDGVEPRLTAVLAWVLGEITEEDRDALIYTDKHAEAQEKIAAKKQAKLDAEAAKAQEKADRKASREAKKAEKAAKEEIPTVNPDDEDKFVANTDNVEGVGGVMVM